MAEFYDQLKASPSGGAYFAILRAWLDDHQVPLDNDAFLGKPSACVVLIPKALQPHADTRACAPRARELQRQVREQGGVEKAADAVERLTRR